MKTSMPMIIAHGPIAYLANENFQKKKISKLKFREQFLVAIFSFLFGILPDFDLFYTISRGIPAFEHHNLITHTLPFYILTWLILKLLLNFIYTSFNRRMQAVLDRRILNILVDTFLIATISHILADFLVNSVMIFYPFSDMRISILGGFLEPNLFAGYWHSVFFGIEVLAVSIFTFHVYRKFLREKVFATRVLQILIAISILYLPFSIYISLNTYNSSYMYDDISIEYDIDGDGLDDRRDMDIGNTGESNLEKVNEGELLNSVLNIVNINGWSVYSENSIMELVKSSYGGFDSYSLISQAYYDVHLPIEGVLNDYYVKSEGFESYTNNYSYRDLLFEYLEYQDDLLVLNTDSSVNLAISKIFFVVNKEGEILNLGITVEGNYMAIVLDSDERVRLHSYESVKGHYSQDMDKIYIQE